MVYFSKNFQKNAAIRLRKEGRSYSEIKKELLVPKSTLSHWLKNLELTESQIERLKKKRLEAAKAGTEKKILWTSQKIEEIKNSSAKSIKNISDRELWLMGIILYWRERYLRENESDLRKGVRFTSSDPHLIKLFLKWLKDIGKIENDEIGFDIFIGEDKRDIIDSIANHWSKIVGFPKDQFSHIYFQKIKSKRIPKERRRKISKKANFGLLRIRVKASSMLARQIAGWIKGIINDFRFDN